MNYKHLIPGLALLLSIPNAFAMSDPFRLITPIINSVFKLGSFMWVTDKISASKFAIFIVVFALVFWVLFYGAKGTPIIKQKNIAVIIAFALAAISAIFMPSGVAQGIGEMYSLVAAIILAGVPTALVVWMAIKLTKDNPSATPPKVVKTWIKHGVRFLAALIVLSLISGIAQEYGVYTGIFLLIPSKKIFNHNYTNKNNNSKTKLEKTKKVNK
jgi:hypothetical protein